MEGLSPALKCLIEMQASISNGESIRSGIQRYLHSSSPIDEFAQAVRSLVFAWDQGREFRSIVADTKSPHRRALLELIASSLSGQTVSSHLDSLKTEIEDASRLEIQAHLEMLPLKMLIPLLLFQFPAFLLLMFGPLLRHLVEELNK